MVHSKKTKKVKTVLLIDDEVPWLELMSTSLQDDAFKIITAENGEQALRMIKRKKPDLILSDIRMPVISGFDLYEKVHSNPKFKDIPYVFMTSIDDYDARRTAKQLGVNDYIVKPFDTEDAKAIILDLLIKFQKEKNGIKKV